MKLLSLALISTLLLFFAPSSLDASTSPSSGVWPQPRSAIGGGTTTLTIEASGAPFFKPAHASAQGPLLLAAYKRYEQLTFPHPPPIKPLSNSSTAATSSSLRNLVISVDSDDESHPQLDTDESYSLSITASFSPSANLHAKTVYGALRGLETFSQMVTFDFDTETYQLPNAPWKIRDAPRFAHRGLMIDTARHFEPLAALRGIIDSLPYAKINVLHWHLVDTQSFPFHSESNPKLWAGAYDDASRYTHADVASIVEYARLRGIRVMPEFDTPGHAQSWCVGYPELCPSQACATPLDVSRNGTFDLIDRLVGECTGRRASAPKAPSGLFPDDFFHLGGDEVDTQCWEQTPRIASWLQARSMTPDDGYALFVKKVAAIAKANGRRPVQWSEVYDHFKTALPKDVIVHVWKANTNVTEVVANGYNVLRNVGYDSTSWYLDNLNVNWEAIYSNEPCDGVPDSLCPMILGGHGEMWGETVDASDLQQTVWPRLAAIAEKLWSPRALTATPSAASDRLHAFRCLLSERGVAAAPVDNKDAREAPPRPGSCRTQRRR